MNILERAMYFFLFVLAKHTEINFLNNILNWFENKLQKKYLVRSFIRPSPIPTINAQDLTDEKFRMLTNNYRNPVLIKGYMETTNAVKKWDDIYLNEIIKDFRINTVKYIDKFEIDNISFSDYINRMKNEHLYINNNHTIMANFPQLFEDIQPNFTNLLNTLKSCNLGSIHIANLFIGFDNKNKKCTGSNMHCGGSGNFFCMLHGKKHWTLIDPEYSYLLKGRVAETGIHAQSLFDMLDTDLDKVPLIFNYLPRYEVVLEAGDVLYNPPWWWHRIRNHQGLSIAMAIRNNKVTKLNLLNNFTYTLSGYKYLLYNTFVITIYEKFLGGHNNFTTSKTESDKSNVLFEIEKLVKKYPTSLDISTM